LDQLPYFSSQLIALPLLKEGKSLDVNVKVLNQVLACIFGFVENSGRPLFDRIKASEKAM
jgi:hypothetical protein